MTAPSTTSEKLGFGPVRPSTGTRADRDSKPSCCEGAAVGAVAAAGDGSTAATMAMVPAMSSGPDLDPEQEELRRLRRLVGPACARVGTAVCALRLLDLGGVVPACLGSADPNFHH